MNAVPSEAPSGKKKCGESDSPHFFGKRRSEDIYSANSTCSCAISS